MANKSKSKKTKTKGNAASTIMHLFSFTFVFRCFTRYFQDQTQETNEKKQNENAIVKIYYC